MAAARRVAVALGTAVVLMFSASGTASAAPVAALPGDGLPFSSAVFRATHNSYSGNVDGSKGSIVSQLDRGVRFLEFDIHDNGYATNRDYSIGHDAPGNKVDHACGRAERQRPTGRGAQVRER